MNEKSLVVPPRRTQRDLAQKAASLKAKNAKRALKAAKGAVTDDAAVPPRGPDRLLSKTEVCIAVGKTFATLWAWMRDKPARFPRAHDLHGSPVWFESEIDAFKATLPIKTYLGDDKHEPEPWRRKSPGRYSKANHSRRKVEAEA